MMVSTGTKYNYCLVAVVAALFIISLIFHQHLVKLPTFRYFQVNCTCRESEWEEHPDVSMRRSQPTATEVQIKKIISEIDQLVPKVTFTHKDNTTCAGMSRASIISPRDRYCIGDNVTVLLDMYDYLGNRKKHGGDALRARIYSPDLRAGASGTIEDFYNGTYHVHFTLFWEGKIKLSLILIHPSEGVSALWRTRNAGYKLVIHRGKFTSPTQEVKTECGFELNTTEKLCEYLDQRDEESFYCVKPAQLPCGSLTEISSVRTHQTYLSSLELSLFDRPNIRVEIPHGLKDITVFNCTDSSASPKEKCGIDMRRQFPGGYVLQNVWTPLSCTMIRFSSQDHINNCLMRKSLHFMGDSTVRQWMSYLTSTVKTLKEFDLYEAGWQKVLLALDVDRNIQVKWKKHGNPFACDFYSVREELTIPRQIDQVGGNKHTVIIVSLGAHFRAFPLHLFIRRVINIRRAIERLYLRSPETHVVIKTENTSDMERDFEQLSDFHGFVQYSILNSIFQDLNVGVVDAWDMTVAFSTNNMHPPPTVIENEVNLFLTFIC